MEKQARKGLHPAWAVLPVGFYAVHAAVLIGKGDTAHVLWSCHLASLLLAVGLLLRRAAPCGVTVMWLTVGLPSWILASATEHDFFEPTSMLTHVFSLWLALFAVQACGLPRGTWRHAVAGIVAIWIVSRLATPPSINVNFAHGNWAGWSEGTLPYPAFLGLLWAGSAAAFFGIERFLRHHLAKEA